MLLDVRSLFFSTQPCLLRIGPNLSPSTARAPPSRSPDSAGYKDGGHAHLSPTRSSPRSPYLYRSRVPPAVNRARTWRRIDTRKSRVSRMILAWKSVVLCHLRARGAWFRRCVRPIGVGAAIQYSTCPRVKKKP